MTNFHFSDVTRNKNASMVSSKYQSTESAEGSGPLKFYRPIELIGIYVEIKKKKKKKKKKKHTHTEYLIAPFLSFSVFSRTAARATLFQRQF